MKVQDLEAESADEELRELDSLKRLKRRRIALSLFFFFFRIKTKRGLNPTAQLSATCR